MDDKSRAPTSITLPKRGKKLLMKDGIEYELLVPDHDFVVGPKHQMIISVYELFNINNDRIGCLCYFFFFFHSFILYLKK